MAHLPAELPNDLVTLDAESAALRLDATLYPLSALYSAAYIFLDRAYVLLDQPDERHFRATLSWKKAPAQAEGALERLAGEFANELLSCAWRARIAEDSRMVIESTTARALGGALGPPSLDDLESFDFGDEPFDDPLGIALSWEEKYGKKKKEEAAAGAPEEKPDKEPGA
jgi:His-Xaa-Ser system protein HxsD